MESVSSEEREYFNAVYGRELTDGEINEILRPLVRHFEILIDTQREIADEQAKDAEQ